MAGKIQSPCKEIGGTEMRILIILWLIFCFSAGWWMASEHYKPEVKRIKSFEQLGPDIRHCLKPMDVDCIVDDPR